MQGTKCSLEPNAKKDVFTHCLQQSATRVIPSPLLTVIVGLLTTLLSQVGHVSGFFCPLRRRHLDLLPCIHFCVSISFWIYFSFSLSLSYTSDEMLKYHQSVLIVSSVQTCSSSDAQSASQLEVWYVQFPGQPPLKGLCV